MATEPDDYLVTRKEAAFLVGKSERTVRSWVAAGILAPTYVGRRTRHLYRAGDVWEAERKVRRGEVSVRGGVELRAPMPYSGA